MLIGVRHFLQKNMNGHQDGELPQLRKDQASVSLSLNLNTQSEKSKIIYVFMVFYFYNIQYFTKGKKS